MLQNLPGIAAKLCLLCSKVFLICLKLFARTLTFHKRMMQICLHWISGLIFECPQCLDRLHKLRRVPFPRRCARYLINYRWNLPIMLALCMLDAFAFLICQIICWHNWRKPNTEHNNYSLYVVCIYVRTCTTHAHRVAISRLTWTLWSPFMD